MPSFRCAGGTIDFGEAPERAPNNRRLDSTNAAASRARVARSALFRTENGNALLSVPADLRSDAGQLIKLLGKGTIDAEVATKLYDGLTALALGQAPQVMHFDDPTAAPDAVSYAIAAWAKL